MIVSCHVPKTAGTTFREFLRKQFGEGLHLDYGDRVGWTGPEAQEWRRTRGIPSAIVAGQRSGAVAAVHGHFYASKYAAAYPNAAMVAFIREPVARVVSNYRYLAEHPEIDHPLVAQFHAAKPELRQWIEWPWARNAQSSLLDVPLERFAFIGITEQFEQSLRIFDRLFGTSLIGLNPPARFNISTLPVMVDNETVARVTDLNRDDIALYRQALARFEQETVELKGELG